LTNIYIRYDDCKRISVGYRYYLAISLQFMQKQYDGKSLLEGIPNISGSPGRKEGQTKRNFSLRMTER